MASTYALSKAAPFRRISSVAFSRWSGLSLVSTAIPSFFATSWSCSFA